MRNVERWVPSVPAKPGDQRRTWQDQLFTWFCIDQLIACDSRSALDSFKQTLYNKFECSDSGPAGYFLGLNIYRDRPARKLYLSQQQHYLEAILDRFDLVDCNPARNPLPSGFRPVLATDEENPGCTIPGISPGGCRYALCVHGHHTRSLSRCGGFISIHQQMERVPLGCHQTPTSLHPRHI